MEDRKDMQTRLVPGVGRLPYPAYRGKEPYVFISYARLDSEQVFAEIKRFNEAGFHVWYDEGIAPGNEWSDAIAEALSNCSVFVVLLLPSVAPLLGCLMLGNLFKESGVTDRLSDTAQNALMNIVTIFLAVSVGGTALYDRFLTPQTIFIIILGLLAFEFATMGGLLLGKLMCKITGGKINPLIGSAGVSAVPMAARVSQKEGAKANPSNFLLMHAMGPNVAGVIGSAVAAGFMLAVFGG